MARRKVPEGVIQSVDRALELILIMADADGDVSLTSLARELKVHASTVHRLLTTLMARGFVEQNPETDRYRLGLKFLELSNSVLSRLDLRTEALPVLRELMKSTGETANLVILDNDEVVYIDKVESSASLRLFSRIGRRAPVHSTAVGKVLLTDLGPSGIRKIVASKGMPKLAKNTITDLDRLLTEVEEVRRRGYAIDDEECEDGARCIAAPVYDHRGNVVAAVSVSGPTGRFTADRLAQLAEYTMEAGRRISIRLGYVSLPGSRTSLLPCSKVE